MRAMTPSRILLIDDHAMFRSGLRMVLDKGLHNIEVFESGRLDDALNYTAITPDLVLLDLKLPGLNGEQGISLLKRKWPLSPVIVLSSQDEPETVRSVLARGAAVFISKADAAEKIIEAIQLVLNGQISALAAKTGEGNSIHWAPQKCLTPRQSEVLDLLCKGMSNKLIARQLNLSVNTVRVHVQAILDFLQVSNRAEAMCAARRMGLIAW